jgi:hypothetical protein
MRSQNGVVFPSHTSSRHLGESSPLVEEYRRIEVNKRQARWDTLLSTPQPTFRGPDRVSGATSGHRAVESSEGFQWQARGVSSVAKDGPRYDLGMTHRLPESDRIAIGTCSVFFPNRLRMAGEQGFEPQYRGPEPRVLPPLHDQP